MSSTLASSSQGCGAGTSVLVRFQETAGTQEPARTRLPLTPYKACLP